MKSTTNKPPPQPKMYETENDISQNRRVEISALLNQRLADAVDLQTQMKQAHWNVKGPHFIGLHELFDKIDEAVEAYVDLIAERFQWLKDFRKFKVSSLAFGRPLVHRGAVRKIDGAESSLRYSRRLPHRRRFLFSGSEVQARHGSGPACARAGDGLGVFPVQFGFCGKVCQLDRDSQSEWSESDSCQPVLLLHQSQPPKLPAPVL